MEVKKILRIICLQAQTVTGDPLPITNFGKTNTIWRHCGVLLPSDQGRQIGGACNMHKKEEKRK
jgi:hypothetical protein